jgi:hypothetical protein
MRIQIHFILTIFCHGPDPDPHRAPFIYKYFVVRGSVDEDSDPAKRYPKDFFGSGYENIRRIFSFLTNWKNSLKSYTATSRDVNFCYPDRVPLTHFVHIAKNNSVRQNFLLSFLRHRNFPAVERQIYEHRRGGNLRPLDFEPDTLPLRHCILV